MPLCIVGAQSAREVSLAAAATTNTVTPDYSTRVQPIFDRRCIACHGCLGSPCNVKLDSFAGADRGGFGLNPYSTHLSDYPRTDMDAAHSTAAWRERGFYPILARTGSPQQNLDQSLLFALVDAGMRHNIADFSRSALDGLRSLRYADSCPSSREALAEQLREHPSLGMPYGLPAISTQDFKTLRDWVAAGSPGPSRAQQERAKTVSNPEAVVAWEGFFNASNKRTRLVSRFIYEHVFLATIVLDESPGDQFRLVRSSTPPMRMVDDGQGGQRIDYPPVRVIGTGLPYDDPYENAGVDQFWYRLQKRTEAPVQKNHFLWRLRSEDIAHLRELFRLDSGEGWGDGWREDGGEGFDKTSVSDTQEMPPWDIGNPFLVFAAIPTEARYRFLLENAEVIISGITYGPVCNGQTATYAVKDHFWVWFLDPTHDPSVQDPKLGLPSWDVFMDRSASGNAAYLKAHAAALARIDPDGWSLDAVWNGDGDNGNAWLTVLRHETNISVLQGGQGGIPRTFWLLDYSGLERMYYDTVAGFAYWQGDGGKLQTLLFFNLLRQAFEDNFLLLLPPDRREPIRRQWTRGIGALALEILPFASKDQPTRVRSSGTDPLGDLVGQIAAYLGPRISGLPDALNPRIKPDVQLDRPMEGFDDWDAAIATLTAVKGLSFVPHLPSVIMLRLTHDGQHRVYSLVANQVFKSQFTLVFQDGQRLPGEDTMSVYPTLVNGFPNLFIDLDFADAPRFLADLQAVQSRDDWQRYAARYGILRNSERFWSFYDWLNTWNFNNRGDAAGWLDLTHYDAAET